MSAEDCFSQSHHADSSPHSPLLRSWRRHEGASPPASTVVGIDGEDSSEPESVAVRKPLIYTPTSSQARSDGTISADEESTMGERESLFSTDPPPYEDISPTAESTPVQQDDGLKSCLEDNAGKQALPSVSNSSSQGKQCRCRREKRFKGRRRGCCIFLKIATLLGLAIYFIAKFTFHHRRKIPIHDPESLGQIPVPPTREIVVDRGNNSINGRWPLYDLLSLTTTSGSIYVTIEPQPADPDDPEKPARVILESRTGSITVSFSTSHLKSFSGGGNGYNDDGDDELEPRQRKNKRDFKPGCRRGNKRRQYYYTEGYRIDSSSVPVPARPYEIEIRTQTGSISARVIFATYARIESTTGSISATLTPVVYAGSSSNKDISINTHTIAGSQHIQITEPHCQKPKRLSLSRDLHAQPDVIPQRHHRKHGSHLSANWAGRVQGYALVGSVQLKGDGLQVIRERNSQATGIKKPGEDGGRGRELHKWWGSHGDMNVSLAVKGAGSISFVVG